MKREPRLLFIVGNSRSGTTMLGRVLGNHSQIHTFDELHFFEHEVDAADVRRGTAWPQSRSIALLERLMTTAREGLFCKVIPGKYRSEAQHILSGAEGNGPISAYKAFLLSETAYHGKTIPCEQTPRYLFFAGELLEVFPNARLINMVRDPRDVLLSQKNKWRRRFLGARNIPFRETLRAWVNYHPYIIARLWLAASQTARRFEGHDRFSTIRFEELIQDPETVIRTLCGFAGIDFEPSMLDVPQVGSSLGEDNPGRIGIDAGRSGNWRKGGLTPVEVAICQNIVGDEMLLRGYIPKPIALTIWRKAASTTVFIFKGFLAFVLNLHRTRNLIETLRRRLAKGGDAA